MRRARLRRAGAAAVSDHDEIAWLMETLDVSFVEAVEIIAVQREGLEWLERNRPAQPPEDAE